jgi:hypothetical protein
MSLRDRVWDEARGLAERGIETIADVAHREALRRQAEPEIWYRFHALMAARLPKWRVLARAFHCNQARRYKAMSESKKGAAAVRKCVALGHLTERG